MRLTDTGNVYMTYPGPGRPMSDWDAGKQMNLDMISDPFMKFPGVLTENNKELLEQLVEVSKQYKERLDALTSERSPRSRRKSRTIRSSRACLTTRVKIPTPSSSSTTTGTTRTIRADRRLTQSNL